MVSNDAEWHIRRRKQVHKIDPQVKHLDGPFYPSALIILSLVAFQYYLWTWIQLVDSYALIGFLAWINSNTALYMLTTFIHENSHGLILGYNRRLLSAVLIELGFLSFGEQWEYTILHHALHHPQLNDSTTDRECPGPGHISVPKKGAMFYLAPILQLFPLGIFLTNGGHGQESNEAHSRLVNKDKRARPVLLGTTLSVYAVLLYLGMYRAALFSVWSISFYISCWCISLHGQAIGEHFRHSHEPGQTTQESSPTRSTYYWLENFIGFNTGYHDEHHTFPNVSWYYLPRLTKTAPGVFCHKQPRRYLSLWFDWFSNGFMTERYRICRQPLKPSTHTH